MSCMYCPRNTKCGTKEALPTRWLYHFWEVCVRKMEAWESNDRRFVLRREEMPLDLEAAGMKKHLLIGSRQRFRDHCLNLLASRGGDGIWDHSRGRFVFGDTEYIHISQPHQLRGYHGVGVGFIGGIQLEDINEWEHLAECARMK